MRQRLLLDRNWRFALGHAADASKDFEFARDRSLVKSGEARGGASPAFDDKAWSSIDLPHDWAIDLPLIQSDDREVVEHAFRAIGPGHPQNSVGWYRRKFEIPKSDLGLRIGVEFDGVFRDSVVWINGHRLGRHESGHTSFRYDLTDLLNYGGENVLAVRVDATCYEGWWYEGAGIYRHVWLTKTSPIHVGHLGTHVIARPIRDMKARSDEGSTKARIWIATTIQNESDEPAQVEVEQRVTSVARKMKVKLAPWETREVEQELVLAKAKWWSPDEPTLYTLHTTLRQGRAIVDTYETSFGVRTFRWDSKRGFFLNGKPLKIKGTCNHQNHAGVGTAMPDRLHEWRVQKLKELGSNAYRCSHYMATPELLDACDRHGMLVFAENRLADVGPEFMGQWEAMIRRDRNRACIFLWSMGNEEHTIQWKVAGERIGKTLIRRAHELDPTRMVTNAMHDRGLGEGFANVVDVHGWNYMNVGDIEAFHKRRPEQPIIGSEEASTVTTRGIYADDAKRGYVSAYDLRHPKWGTTAEKWLSYFMARPWLAGAFVWTGFDYRGEPIPYKWPCTSSHFGLMDLCGFPKDLYYYYKAWWSDQPVLHIFPHWNAPVPRGKEADVWAFSNCDEVELFVNGKSLGRQRMQTYSHVAWKATYQPGQIEAIGYRNGRRVMNTRIETTGRADRLVLEVDRESIDADGEDIAIVNVSAVDSLGRAVPDADQLVQFDVRGAGRLLGVGNGDPSSHEKDHAGQRRLFSGLAQLIVHASREPGSIRITTRSAGLKPAALTISARQARPRPAVP